MFQHYKRPLAVLALFSLAACGGGSSSSSSTPPVVTVPPAVVAPQSGAAILTTIVGVGDSLTAGTQSGVTMGEKGSNPLSAYPGNITPPTQENGFWSLLFQQAKGVPPLFMYDPNNSPLPLIHQPGIGSQLVLATPAAGKPFISTHPSCDAFNAAGFSRTSALTTVRINGASTVLDTAVPGITVHEALYMNSPLTGPPPPPDGSGNCPGYAASALDPTAGPLQSVVAGESSLYYPILGGFAGSPTMVNAAAGLHPTLATVWLGANDLLKFIFSGGNPILSDSPAQMQADMTTIIATMQNSGARVVVANLPDILSTSQFFPGGVPNANPQAFDNQFVTFATQLGVPAPAAKAYADALTAQMAQAPPPAGTAFGPAYGYGVTSAGYLTESGFFAVFAAGVGELKAGAPPSLPDLDQGKPGSGLGGLYINDTFAVSVRGLNTAYNGAIGAAAAAQSAPLVDIASIFAKFQTVTYPGQVLSPKCCFLVFGGGLQSFDGLHPSNTGYAFIANEFIKTINAAYSLTIPAVNVMAVYKGTAPYLFPDPYAQ
ncbi:MAG: hypothetical protein M3N19_00355 [Candidatus Eremiobacteraeota bacterium]|nr:hypothetical protein [Candidatus Eremiobacteraeota bacterium]